MEYGGGWSCLSSEGLEVACQCQCQCQYHGASKVGLFVWVGPDEKD